MKNLKAPLIAIAFILSLASCKKNDVKPNTENATPNTTQNVQSVLNVQSLSWKSADDWKVANQQSFKVFYTSLSDTSITSDVVSSGMVLVYKKSLDGTISRLPFEEKVAGQVSNYWYYQVSEGKVLISCDNYTNSSSVSKDNFQVVVVNKEQINSLTNKGYENSKLMELDYNQVSGL
jgi:hypothetical protein